MNKIIFIILILFSGLSAQSNSDQEELLFKTEQLKRDLKKLQLKIDSVNSYNQKLIENNYSLRDRIMEYEVKDDFFDSAFNSQTYRFTLVVAGLFALTLILVYASFNYQSRVLNEKFGGQILSQKNTFVDLRGKVEDLEYSMYISLGNISNLLSEFHSKNKNPFLTIKYALISANYIYKATQIDNRNRDDKIRWQTACLGMLVIADKTLNQIKLDQNYIDAFKASQDELMEQLAGVSLSKKSEIYDFAAKIKLRIKEIVKN